MHRSSRETECETDSGCEDCQGGSGTQSGGERVYREEEIPGKGIGCIASKELPAGSLVIREVPALYVTPDLDGHAETIRAFAEMEPRDQRELLRLFNLYSKPESEWSASMLKELKDCEEDAGGDLDSISEVSRETALQVWQIWLTNAYDNGVFLKLSRFNHSCRPNTEYFWNTDLEVIKDNDSRQLFTQQNPSTKFQKNPNLAIFTGLGAGCADGSPRGRGGGVDRLLQKLLAGKSRGKKTRHELLWI